MSFSKLPNLATKTTPKKELNIEIDSLDEVQELKKKFTENAKKEESQRDQQHDSEFWFAVYFKTREQKETFLKLVGIINDDKYINGSELAKKLNIEFPTIDLKIPKKRDNKKFATFVDKF